jgi:hypothetical protein
MFAYIPPPKLLGSVPISSGGMKMFSQGGFGVKEAGSTQLWERPGARMRP